MSLLANEVVSQINFKIDNQDILAYEFDSKDDIWIEEADDYCSLFRWQHDKKENEIYVFVAWYEDYDISEDVTHLFNTDALLRYFQDQETNKKIADGTEQYEEYYRKAI